MRGLIVKSAGGRADIRSGARFSAGRGRRAEEGIALIMVLWVITLLMAIVLSFSFSTRTTTSTALAFREGMEARFVAESGIQRGIMEVFYRRQNMNQPLVEGEEGIWKVDGTLNGFIIGSGECFVRVMDESGKVDINRATDVILKNLFLNLGIQEDQVNIIVDSIMDWKDEDNLHRLSGAEDEYYMSLPRPYRAKNSSFDTIEELLLVRGITPAILYGEGKRRGVIDFLTVSSGTDKINPSAAPREALMAIPGMSPEIADSIIELRKEKLTLTAQDLALLLGPGYVTYSPYFSLNEGNIYSIEAVGRKKDTKGQYAIRSVVAIEGNKHTYFSYKSPATATAEPEAAAQ
ncbi:MAG: hypothetical protein WC291_07720 [Thermodesulfovibrionales bacterium]|jgi:general secretion pathway protein K